MTSSLKPAVDLWSRRPSDLYWPMAKIRALIALWADRPVLYDPSMCQYHSRTERTEVYEEMAGKLGVPMKEVALKIKRLKCNYRREKERIAVKSLTAELYTCKWVYFKSLGFLDGYVDARPGAVNAEVVKTLTDQRAPQTLPASNLPRSQPRDQPTTQVSTTSALPPTSSSTMDLQIHVRPQTQAVRPKSQWKSAKVIPSKSHFHKVSTTTMARRQTPTISGTLIRKQAPTSSGTMIRRQTPTTSGTLIRKYAPMISGTLQPGDKQPIHHAPCTAAGPQLVPRPPTMVPQLTKALTSRSEIRPQMSNSRPTGGKDGGVGGTNPRKESDIEASLSTHALTTSRQIQSDGKQSTRISSHRNIEGQRHGRSPGFQRYPEIGHHVERSLNRGRTDSQQTNNRDSRLTVSRAPDLSCQQSDSEAIFGSYIASELRAASHASRSWAKLHIQHVLYRMHCSKMGNPTDEESLLQPTNPKMTAEVGRSLSTNRPAPSGTPPPGLYDWWEDDPHVGSPVINDDGADALFSGFSEDIDPISTNAPVFSQDMGVKMRSQTSGPYATSQLVNQPEPSEQQAIIPLSAGEQPPLYELSGRGNLLTVSEVQRGQRGSLSPSETDTKVPPMSPPM